MSTAAWRWCFDTDDDYNDDNNSSINNDDDDDDDDEDNNNNNNNNSAVFSLEPLTQDLHNEIKDLRCVNLFTPLPLPCSALPGAWNCSSSELSSRQSSWLGQNYV